MQTQEQRQTKLKANAAAEPELSDQDVDVDRERETEADTEKERGKGKGKTEQRRNGGAAANGKHIFQPRRLFTTNFMAFGRKLLVSVERIAARENRTKIKQKKAK